MEVPDDGISDLIDWIARSRWHDRLNLVAAMEARVQSPTALGPLEGFEELTRGIIIDPTGAALWILTSHVISTEKNLTVLEALFRLIRSALDAVSLDEVWNGATVPGIRAILDPRLIASLSKNRRLMQRGADTIDNFTSAIGRLWAAAIQGNAGRTAGALAKLLRQALTVSDTSSVGLFGRPGQLTAVRDSSSRATIVSIAAHCILELGGTNSMSEWLPGLRGAIVDALASRLLDPELVVITSICRGALLAGESDAMTPSGSSSIPAPSADQLLAGGMLRVMAGGDWRSIQLQLDVSDMLDDTFAGGAGAAKGAATTGMGTEGEGEGQSTGPPVTGTGTGIGSEVDRALASAGDNNDKKMFAAAAILRGIESARAASMGASTGSAGGHDGHMHPGTTSKADAGTGTTTEGHVSACLPLIEGVPDPVAEPIAASLDPIEARSAFPATLVDAKYSGWISPGPASMAALVSKMPAVAALLMRLVAPSERRLLQIAYSRGLYAREWQGMGRAAANPLLDDADVDAPTTSVMSHSALAGQEGRNDSLPQSRDSSRAAGVPPAGRGSSSRGPLRARPVRMQRGTEVDESDANAAPMSSQEWALSLSLPEATNVLEEDFSADKAVQQLIRAAAPVARQEAELIAALHGGELSQRALEAISQGTRAETLAAGRQEVSTNTYPHLELGNGPAEEVSSGPSASHEIADDPDGIIAAAMGYDHRGHVVADMEIAEEGAAEGQDQTWRGAGSRAGGGGRSWVARRRDNNRVLKLADMIAAVTERLDRLTMVADAVSAMNAASFTRSIGPASGAGAGVDVSARVGVGVGASDAVALPSSTDPARQIKTPFTTGRPAFLALLRSCVSKATSSIAVKRAALNLFYALLRSPLNVKRGELAAVVAPIVIDACADGASSLDEPIMQCLLQAAAERRLGPSTVLRLVSTGIDGVAYTASGSRSLGSLGAQPPNRQYRCIEFCRVVIERVPGNKVRVEVRRRLVRALVSALQSRSAAVRDLAAGCLSEALDLVETEGDDVELPSMMQGVDLLKAASLAGKAPAAMKGAGPDQRSMGGARFESDDGTSPFLGRNGMPSSVRAAGLSIAKLGRVADAAARSTLGQPRVPSLRRQAERRLQELLMGSGDGTAGMAGTEGKSDTRADQAGGSSQGAGEARPAPGHVGLAHHVGTGVENDNPDAVQRVRRVLGQIARTGVLQQRAARTSADDLWNAIYLLEAAMNLRAYRLQVSCVLFLKAHTRALIRRRILSEAPSDVVLLLRRHNIPSKASSQSVGDFKRAMFRASKGQMQVGSFVQSVKKMWPVARTRPQLAAFLAHSWRIVMEAAGQSVVSLLERKAPPHASGAERPEEDDPEEDEQQSASLTTQIQEHTQGGPRASQALPQPQPQPELRAATATATATAASSDIRGSSASHGGANTFPLHLDAKSVPLELLEMAMAADDGHGACARAGASSLDDASAGAGAGTSTTSKGPSMTSDDRLLLLATWVQPIERHQAGAVLDTVAMQRLLRDRVHLQELSLDVLRAVRQLAPVVFALLDPRDVFDRMCREATS